MTVFWSCRLCYNIQIYVDTLGVVTLYVNFSPQDSVVRGLAAQTADSKIRVWGPRFPSSAILWFVRNWGPNVTTTSFLKLTIYYDLKYTTFADQHNVHTMNADVYLMCEISATVKVYGAECSLSDAVWCFFQKNSSFSFTKCLYH